MPGLQDTLQAALGAAYVVERELGGGGMARVFVARELALGRRVVVKVLPPELTETVSADRFHREIQVAANLQHPHIVPLLSAGRAEGLLYYTMPLVEGETLRGRVMREGELPVSEACRILAEVARALSYAHRHGIVHRDIKPENVLLSEGEAQVADFGIAKALAAAGASDSLTTMGLVLGTPAYMAPEQAAGEGTLDARTDLYSLGVVAYEMLTGALPFNERTAQAMMAAHAVRSPEPVSIRRRAVPARLGTLVMRMLEKRPADRPQTADEVLHQLDAMVDTKPFPVSEQAQSSAARRGRWLVAGGVVALALLAAAAWLRSRPSAPTLDPQVLAVVPFRVTGADASLRYLREGMLDLLATKLSGTRELRTVDPRTLLRAWRRAGGSAGSDVDRNEMLVLARAVGAGRILEGEIIGTPNRVVLNARLSSAAGRGEVRASVEGPADSLTSLVDRLAAQLLALGAGVEEHRLATLTTTSLPALRAYLDGRSAHRQGDFATARRHFDRAMELDSSFALAGLGRTESAIWLGEYTNGPGSLLAWRHRDRLSPRDLALLRYMLGRRYPLFSNVKEGLADVEALVTLAPDSPEAWASLGDQTYHYGPLVGMSDASERSLQAYQRALALDSSFAPSLEHLHELFYGAGDTANARRAVALRLRVDSITPLAAAVRWFARRLLADSMLGAVPLSDDSLLTRPFQVVGPAIRYGIGLADAESVLSLSRAKVSNDTELKLVLLISRVFFLIRGQPRRAQVGMRDPATPEERADAILDALYSDADSVRAAKLAAEVPRTFTRPKPPILWGTIMEHYAAAQYDLNHGRTTAAKNAVQAWRGSWTVQDTSYAVLLAAVNAILLDAQLAARDRRPDALARLTELDSVLQAGPTWGGFEGLGDLIAARLWHERGDPVRALSTVRRRVAGLAIPPSYATSLREEARYAALAGEREDAIKAYRHYLALRSEAEPGVRPQVEAVRAELAALERESGER
jgi:eukaryotic-like serine/threonine-protein kinase